jgi:cytochrome oxidase assembly protein ShyY1
MSMRWPLLPTVIVGLAVVTMLALGVWQLQRKSEKEAVLAQYAAAANQPAIAWPSVPLPEELPLFRKSSLMCVKVDGWESTAGKNAVGKPGFAHIAHCQTGGAEGPGAKVALGWTTRPESPDWSGGPVSGVIAPDNVSLIRLVASEPPAGLDRLAPPSIESIPNNHLLYAIQWFFFAAAATLIYVLALRRRDAGR